MTYREREALDDWITGHGGQDQFRDEPALCDLCGEPLDEGDENVHQRCADYENGYSDWVSEQMARDREFDYGG